MVDWDKIGEKVKAMYGDGVSAATIAAMLRREAPGLTRNAVLAKANRHGWTTPNSAIYAHGEKRPEYTPDTAPRGRHGGKASFKSGPEPRHPKVTTDALTRPRAAVPLPPALPPEPPPLEGPLLTIFQLSDKTCKWPIGDPGEKGFGFCGHKPREASAYCEYHARLAYQPLYTRPPVRRPFGT